MHDDDEDDWSALKAADTSLDTYEALELLALGEVVARKAHDSQLIGIRAALRGGAGWEQIGAALGITRTPPTTPSRTPSRASWTPTPPPPPASWPGRARPADLRPAG